MRASLNLPPVYELISLERSGALEEAIRLAIQGADEGTLIWRRAPLVTTAVTDLDCALILRPDCRLDTAAQLIYVAAVSLGSALSEAIQSLVGLRFRWPNRVQVGLEHTAFLELRWPLEWARAEARNVAWLVLGARLKGRLDTIADDAPFPDPRSTEAKILEGFGKHFLADINRWAEAGFQQTRKRWLSRADGVDEPIQLAVGNNSVEGIFETIDDQGRLALRTNDGVRRDISVVDFFAP